MLHSVTIRFGVAPAAPPREIVITEPALLDLYWSPKYPAGVGLVRPECGGGPRRAGPEMVPAGDPTALARLTRYLRDLDAIAEGLERNGASVELLRDSADPGPCGFLVVARPESFDALVEPARVTGPRTSRLHRPVIVETSGIAKSGTRALDAGSLDHIVVADTDGFELLSLGPGGATFRKADASRIFRTRGLRIIRGVRSWEHTPDTGGLDRPAVWAIRAQARTDGLLLTADPQGPRGRAVWIALSVCTPDVWNRRHGLPANPELWILP